MASVEFDLKHGLKAEQNGKEVVHRHVVLGELTAGDIIEAQQESERLVMTPKGPALVSSPALVGALTLCRQVKKIGDVEIMELSMLSKLHEDDLEILQIEAAKLSQAAEEAGKELSDRGRSDDGGE